MLLRKLGRIGQSTAEYAVVLALVVGAVVAMQIYVKRGLQGRVKDAVDHKGAGGTVGDVSFSFTSGQYEPYYLASDRNSAQSQTSNDILGRNGETGRASAQASIMDSKTEMTWGETKTVTADDAPDMADAEGKRGAIPATPDIITAEE